MAPYSRSIMGLVFYPSLDIHINIFPDAPQPDTSMGGIFINGFAPFFRPILLSCHVDIQMAEQCSLAKIYADKPYSDSNHFCYHAVRDL